MHRFTLSLLAIIAAIAFIPKDAEVILIGLALIVMLYTLATNMTQQMRY